jgi:hypothetical protein
MLQLQVTFHGQHHLVLNLMITIREIIEQSNLLTLLSNQVHPDSHTKIQIFSVLKEIPKLFKPQLWFQKYKEKEPKKHLLDLML